MTENFEKADEARADVPRLPSWVSLVVIVGGSLALWAGIFVAVL